MLQLTRKFYPEKELSILPQDKIVTTILVMKRVTAHCLRRLSSGLMTEVREMYIPRHAEKKKNPAVIRYMMPIQ